MSRYCSENPETQSDEKTIQYFHHKSQLKLTTDAGVFSRGKIDFGSDSLVQTFSNEHPPGPNKCITDAGCGYGPIGLMIVKVSPHRQMTMVDVSHRALHSAEKNRKQDQIDNVTTTESDGLSQIENEYLDFISTNPPIRAGKNIVHRIFEEAYQKLESQGELYVVIQKKQGAPSTKKKMEEIFNNVEIVNKSKGYYTLKSQKS